MEPWTSNIPASIVEPATLNVLVMEAVFAMETAPAKEAVPAVTLNPLFNENVLFKNETFCDDVAPFALSK